MLNVGLTGGIGAGKSEVTRRLAALGAVVIDADAAAREVVAIGTPGLDAVLAEFGNDMRGADGGLDREKLAGLVFNDREALARLNAVVHPLVAQRVDELMAAARSGDSDTVVINDVPLIAESKVAARYDTVVVVDAPAEVQLDRLTRLRGMAEDAAKARMASQVTREERRAIADYVIVNDGDLNTLDQQIAEVWEQLVGRAREVSDPRRTF